MATLFQLIAAQKDLVTTIQSGISALALLIGGFWAYLVFIRHRERFPSANVGQTMYTKVLDADHRLIKVTISVANTSTRLLVLDKASVHILQLFPTPSGVVSSYPNERVLVEDHSEIDWECIGDREMTLKDYRIEPKETDIVCVDFIIGTTPRTIQIDSYLKNKVIRCKEIGWNVTTVHDL
jgi:hypothetical protein